MPLRKLVREFNMYLKNNESLLERDFKHVAEKIELHWGYPEFYPFINKLLVNDHDRKRNGFPQEVMEEIHTLYEIHCEKYPELRSALKTDSQRYQ
ncbi:hypothetical protein SAMN05216326_1183 [Nitrosomonas marina]|uniref:Uncharacterized protein n=1 Tax=Nitrosomonas marina TaxID=917 RepID=A0A1I0D2P9_9PROT|nr:hypothetical protein [Nitrosomonas marina]SET26483.1 hypothetical protein SAMN05216326_1183 [Nitrosomonas marina]